MICNLKYCYACGRSRDGSVQEPVCTSHPRLSYIGRKSDGIIRNEVAEWKAASWEHVFFLIRAFVIVTKFVMGLPAAQLAAMRREPCPITSWLADTPDLIVLGRPYTIGSGADGFLRMSELGWDAFLADNPTSQRLKAAAEAYFREWFEDVAS
jgi:hypothetical protein